MASLSKQLEDYASGASLRAFDWETANCCHFAAGWVSLMTGRDPMAGLRVTKTERGARRLIRELGGSLDAAWTKRLGRAPILPTLAQIGDIVLFPLGDGKYATGICAGRFALCVDDAGKVVRAEMDHASHAWRLSGDAA